jgi:Na+/H+-dicarboxylate symporter
MTFSERFMPALTVGSFIGGVFIGKYSELFTGLINGAVNKFVELYGFFAPVAIFIILAPSLGRTFRTPSTGKFVLYFTWWYFVRKILACVWACVFCCFVFQLPFLPQGTSSVWAAVMQTLKSLGRMMVVSPYFWAMYLSVIVAAVSKSNKLVCDALEKTLETVEFSGKYFIPIIPVFMVAIGTYVQGLPTHLGEQMDLKEGMVSLLHPFTVLGIPFNPATSVGMISIYVSGALLVGLACFIWHLALLMLTKYHSTKGFSIKSYFLDYWVKVYPLLWSTSSESIATPLNLYLVKRYAAGVRPMVRRFAVGVGSYMNINGTLICVFVLGCMVFNMLGIPISMTEWLLAIPMIVLISYGVPGIPGELILFAGPIAIMLNLPAEIQPVFIAVYVGLQIGLPDSFRTGNNSTDNFLCAVLLNEIYEKKFAVHGETDWDFEGAEEGEEAPLVVEPGVLPRVDPAGNQPGIGPV